MKAPDYDRRVDEARILAIFAHELRSPAAVITGYARMLREGRLDDAHREAAFQRIEQAGGRVSLIGQYASDLSRWLSPEPDEPAQTIFIDTLLSRAMAQVAAPDRVSQQILEGTARIHAIDRDALPHAVGLVIETLLAEARDERISVAARPVDAPFAWDILIGPAPVLTAPVEVPGPDAGEPLSAERVGSNLALVVSAAVIAAHGGRFWTAGGRAGLIGLRLLGGHQE